MCEFSINERVKWVNPFLKADVKSGEIQNFITPHKNQHNNKVMMVRNGLEYKQKCVIKNVRPKGVILLLLSLGILP